MADRKTEDSSFVRLQRLQSVTDAALAHLSLDELLEELLERIRDALEADTSAILLHDEETSELVVRASKGIEEAVEQGIRIPVGKGFAGRVAAERRPVALDDVDHADVVNPLLRAKGIKSLLGAPLLVRGRVLGVVHVGTLKPRQFSREDSELLQLVADRAALAIDHAALLAAERSARERAEETGDRLRKVLEITDVALAHLSLEELLEELLDRIRASVGADTSAILLLDEETNELVARAARGIEEEVERGVRIPVGKGFAGRVAANRRPVALDDVDHADVLNPLLREKGIKSLLGAPLLVRGRVLGVVHVGTLTPHRFTASETELLEIVADRVALALERALLHEELVALDRLKREFISTAAHEVRTPTSIIYGVAETLAARRDTLDEATLRGLVDAFYDASVRLARLTEDLLDYSRMEMQPAELEVEPLRIRPIIEEIARGALAQPGEDVNIDIPDDMVFESDRRALERIVGNLIRNALVHGEPPIDISASTANGEARITVADGGPGIAQAFVSRLFDPFSRPREATGRPGVGLGLAIAFSYAQRLGGDLVYEPRDPHGACFTLVLPHEQASGPMPQPREQLSSPR